MLAKQNVSFSVYLTYTYASRGFFLKFIAHRYFEGNSNFQEILSLMINPNLIPNILKSRKWNLITERGNKPRTLMRNPNDSEVL